MNSALLNRRVAEIKTTLGKTLGRAAHLVGVELAVGQLVEGVQGNLGGADVVEVAAAVDAQVGADGEP